MNPLRKFVEDVDHKYIDKWEHYFDIYHEHFKRFRGKPVTVLEIGVSHGGSLQMWKGYFGDHAKILGLDINPICKQLEEERIAIYIGSQDDKDVLSKIKLEHSSIDILIDDGGHTMGQIKTAFQEMYATVSENGIYLVEDIHTSYWRSYGGGFKEKNSFIEYTKNLIDQLNAYHSEDCELFNVDSFTLSTYSICFYDSVVVFEKRKIPKPKQVRAGNKSF